MDRNQSADVDPVRQEEITRISAMTSGYDRARVVQVAVRSGFFEALSGSGPATAGLISEKLQWSERGTRMIADCLVALGLLEKRQGKYHLSALAEKYLLPESPYYQGNIINHRCNLYERWEKLEDAVRLGTAPSRKRESRTEHELRDFILGMANIAMTSAEEMVDKVDVTDCRKMLDLGGGPGTYAIALARMYPALKADVYDLPEVVPIAQEQIKASGVSDRVKVLAGDYHKDPLGEGYDLVLISNIIHSLSAESIRQLFRKASEASVPGAMILVKDFYISEERTGPEFATLFALNMLLGTEDGDVYTRDEVCGWLSEVGYGDFEEETVGDHSTVIIGHKGG